MPDEIQKRTEDAFAAARAEGQAATEAAKAEAADDAKRPRRRKSDTREDVDAELAVMGACSAELTKLAPESRSRVLLYLARRYEPAWQLGERTVTAPMPMTTGGSDDRG